MTAQSTTTLHFDGDIYEILDSRNTLLFDPKLLDIECQAINTANWRGHRCVYSIKAGELYLTSFYMNGSKANKDLATLNFLLVESDEYSVKVEIKNVDERSITYDLLIRSDQFYTHDEKIKIQKSFLIARDRRVQRQLTAARDDFPWYYKSVYLVKTKENRLVSIDNYSNEFYQFYQLFTRDGELEQKYKNLAVDFLNENLGVSFNSYFKIID